MIQSPPNYIPPDYELVSTLGSGQTSVVYLAIHKRFGQVALKLPKPELQHRPILWRMFENEVQITLSLGGDSWRSSNVIKALEGYPTGEKAFLCLEYCSGGTLDELLTKNAKLPFTEATRLILEVARGLEFSLSKQVLHRDVKPANVLLTGDGQAKLADFGTGLFMTERTAERVGTAFYMAPEIFEGKPPSAQSDVYSLGVLAYEVFSGDRPFNGSSYDELMLQHLTSVPVNLKYQRGDVDHDLSQVVAKAMSRDQTKRFTSVGEFVRTFEALSSSKKDFVTGRSARVSQTSDSVLKTSKDKASGTEKSKGLFSWLKRGK